MKKLVLILLSQVLMVSSLMSQSRTESAILLRDLIAMETQKFFTVKGIELKPGFPMQDFLEQAEAKGWTKSKLFDYVKEKYNVYDLEGSFYSTEGCSIKVLPTTTNKNIVGTVAINFPKSDSFKLLKERYDKLKYSLEKKYYLSECTEKFDDEYVESSTSNSTKLLALSRDEGTFESRFYLSDDEKSLLLGYIVLRISHINVDYTTQYYVSISYCTSDNTIEQLGNADDDL